MNDGWRRIKNAGYRTRLYHYTLQGHGFDEVKFLPKDLWPGDTKIADDLFRGRYRFGGKEANAPNQPPWRLRPKDHQWLSELHSFKWLRHFSASGGDAALAHSRRLIRSWIDLCGEIDPITWSPSVVGQRIACWLSHGQFLLEGSDESFSKAFLNSIGVQWLHLQRIEGATETGIDRLFALTGLLYGAMVIHGESDTTSKCLEKIKELIEYQTKQDRGFKNHSPSDLMMVLRWLISIKNAVSDAGYPIPDWLDIHLNRMASVLASLRHGDGGLALFNGGFEEARTAVDLTLAKTSQKDKVLDSAVNTGFERMAAGDAILLADAAPPPAGEWGLFSHSSGGCFELSIGKQRLVVNCGSGRRRSTEWVTAARATGAHSTLQINNSNIWPITENGDFGPYPAPLHCRRDDDNLGNTWLELEHGGYGERFGMMHRRRLYLDAGGTDIRGEDRLNTIVRGGIVKDGTTHSIAVRFHLHPEIQASAVYGGAAVLLRLGNGQGWRFRASGAEIVMDESVYLGQPDRIRRSQQIVLTTQTHPEGNTIKWAFQRV